MKKFLKVFLSLMLIVALGSSSTITSVAATNSKGGTWKITDMVSTQPLSLEDIPIIITYIPYSMVEKFHNADLDTDNFSGLSKEFLAQGLTLKVAKELLKRKGIDLTPFVGCGFIVYDVYKAICIDAYNKGINTAYKAKTGMKITFYQTTIGYYTRYTKWDGLSMPKKIAFKKITGYALGAITPGQYELIND